MMYDVNSVTLLFPKEAGARRRVTEVWMTTAGPSTGGVALPTWSRRPANLASALAEDLVARIVSGQYPSGTVMPSEQALCESFSVSRTVVREAVKMLQEKGLVRVRRGSGTTVTPAVQWNMLDEFVLA